MTAQAHDTVIAAKPPRRGHGEAGPGHGGPEPGHGEAGRGHGGPERGHGGAGPGHGEARPGRGGARRGGTAAVQLTQRDIDGLLLCGEHYGVPYDLLADALRVPSKKQLEKLLARWRRTGYVATGRLGPGPGWCWLTRDGMAATGLGFPATRPALARLAHIRAVLAARLWLAAGPAWADGQAWWHSERRLRAAQPAAGRREHVPDAEIHWPSIEGSPYAGQVWAIEVELTPKPIARTTGIMTRLLAPMQYATVVYLTAPAARPVVLRAAASLPPGEQNRVAVRDLPAAAFTPEPSASWRGAALPGLRSEGRATSEGGAINAPWRRAGDTR
jgi:hypothetical protein